MSKKLTFDCIIFSRKQPTSFKGILGPIDLCAIHLLVDGTGKLLQEVGSTKEVEIKIRNMCESQDLPVKEFLVHKNNLLTFEVDSTNNSIDEQTSWRDTTSKDDLCWRTVFYPCVAGTTKECLGFAQAASKDSLGKYNVANVMTLVLKNPL